jgi:hypothetical protein
LGADIGKNSKWPWKTSVPHPADPEKRLYLMPDPPHIIKNLRSALTVGNKFSLPASFMKKHGLKYDGVELSHINDLIRYQQTMTLKLAPKLDSDLITPGHFDKMNVGMALKLFSPAVAHGLEYLVKECGFSEALLSTAKFIEVVAKWFYYVSSRHPSAALSRYNEDKYREALAFLADVVDLFRFIKIGKGWKPVQTGMIMATKSILEIQDVLLMVYLFKLVLTGRLSQDSLENLFSMIRSKNPIPTAKEFKYNLRAICIAQYLKEHKNSNYQFDDRDCLAEFLENKKASAKGDKVTK